MKLFNEGHTGGSSEKHWMDNTVVVMLGGLTWHTERRIAELVVFPVGPGPVSTRWTPLISSHPHPYTFLPGSHFPHD